MAENQRASTRQSSTPKSSAVLILAAWMVVGLPAGWGVYNTLLNSMKLFKAPVAAATHASSNAPK